MDILNSYNLNEAMPLMVAVVLGLISVVSPCPLTTNISALGYISKNIGDGKRMTRDGLLYALGRIVTYALLGGVSIFIVQQGMNIEPINNFINQYGEKILPPILLLMAIITIRPFHFHKHSNDDCDCGCAPKKRYSGSMGAFVMGLVFALAFCPINGVFFFGMLVPASASAGLSGYLLPILYGLITGLPVVIVIWLIKFGVDKISTLKDNITKIEKWVRYIVAAILVIFAIYFTQHAYFHSDGCSHEHHHHHHHHHTHTHDCEHNH